MGAIGLLVTGALFVAVVLIAIRFGLHVDPEQAPTGAPAWMGPDPTLLSEGLAARVEGFRRRAGLPALVREPALDELAAHAAFDMAVRGWLGESDPDGRGVDARRERLQPSFVGVLRQWQAALDRVSGPDPEPALDRLLAADAPEETLAEAILDPTLGAVGLSAAVERGRARLCVVLAHHFATLDELVPPAEADGWTFTGTLPPDGSPELLRARWAVGDGAWSELVAAGPPDIAAAPRDRPQFRLTLPIPVDAQDLRIQFEHRGALEPARRL